MDASQPANYESGVRRRFFEPIAMSLVVIALVVNGVIALTNFRELQANRLMVRNSNEVRAALRDVIPAVMNAESGQRGFLITGHQSYLEPFDASVRKAQRGIDHYESLTADDSPQRLESAKLRKLVDERVAELQNVLQVRESGGDEAARLAVATDKGERTMDRIGEEVETMLAIESHLLSGRELAAARTYRSGQITSVLSTVIGLVLVVGVLYLLERNRRKAERAAMDLETIRERLQRALDAAALGSWNIDPATSQLIGDAHFRKIFGFDDGDITYQRAIDALHPEDRSTVESAIAASTRGSDPEPYNIEYRIVRADGEVRWVLAKGAANYVGHGTARRLASFDGTLADITGRKAQEQRLLDSERAAQAANQAKSEFLANMSHEIRTPMAAILGYADVLLGHLIDPDNRNCVLVIKRNGQHLLELINDILDLSRIEAGKLDIDIESVALVQLVSDVESLMHVRADEKKLDFRAEYMSRVPQSIRTDATRLRQVLINLIGNAIKFTEAGQVLLQVKFIPSEERIEFAIRDMGIGMTAEQQQRLFKPFSQGDASVTRSYGGSGLGLAISNRLAGMLDGEISVQSEFGVGSTFTVTIPIGSTDDSELVQPERVARSQDAEDVTAVPARLTCRVLVVDDRRDVRHISQHFLEKAGAEVATAEDGQQGIDAAIAARDANRPFDLIVMDMQMPNVDGLQAVAELRSAGIQWPVIALTADAMQGDRDKCLNGGCDDYLSKPIDHVKLVALVAKYTSDIGLDELVARRSERSATLRASLEKS